jgi:hypothetical protein
MNNLLKVTNQTFLTKNRVPIANPVIEIQQAAFGKHVQEVQGEGRVRPIYVISVHFKMFVDEQAVNQVEGDAILGVINSVGRQYESLADISDISAMATELAKDEIRKVYPDVIFA